MAIELRIDIDETIGERDINYSEIKITYQDKTIEGMIVFSRYTHLNTIQKFIKDHPLSSIGVKEKVNQKTVVSVKITSKVYLSKVNKDTYDRWKISKENIVNNSIS